MLEEVVAAKSKTSNAGGKWSIGLVVILNNVFLLQACVILRSQRVCIHSGFTLDSFPLHHMALFSFCIAPQTGYAVHIMNLKTKSRY